MYPSWIINDIRKYHPKSQLRLSFREDAFEQYYVICNAPTETPPYKHVRYTSVGLEIYVMHPWTLEKFLLMYKLLAEGVDIG